MSALPHRLQLSPDSSGRESTILRAALKIWEYSLVSATTAAAVLVSRSHLNRPDGSVDWAQVACLGLFMITLIRFLGGDTEYIRQRYSQEPVHAKARLGFDVGALVMHAVTFLFLGLSVEDPAVFLAVYAVLMVLNVSWLFLNHQGECRIEPDSAGLVCARCLPIHNAAMVWVVNNSVLVAVLALLAITTLSGWLPTDLGLWLGVTAGFANSGADLLLTWWVYSGSAGEQRA